MKIFLQLFFLFITPLFLFAQVQENYPPGFKKANVPAVYKNRFIQKKYIREVINQSANSLPEIQRNSYSPFQLTTIIGTTKFDRQTYNATNNMVVLNNDGSISTCWTFSPDANTSTTPPYPLRGSNYNYYDPGNGWISPWPPGSTQTITSPRTNSPNIVVTPLGNELTIQERNVPGGSNMTIDVNWRAVKGIGAWTIFAPWSINKYYNSVKACCGIINENVYAIWTDSVSPLNMGPIYFSRSTNGGQTWTPEITIGLLDTPFYDAFEPDCYSIDAKGDTVAIAIGFELTDMILLKSFDAGNTWTKTIIQKHPIPNFLTCNCTSDYITNSVTIDTIRTNGGDPKVLIDNEGQCHVWFSALDYHSDTTVMIHYATDGLLYWRESLGPDTTTIWDELTGGHGYFVSIAAAEDFSGNGTLDVPADTFTTCVNFLPWGYYDGGITQMPSAGIDSLGNLYVSYQTINEMTDTTTWHMVHRHIYLTSLAYPYSSNWSPPVNIIPTIAMGGDGENEECVYSSMARKVITNQGPLILYQADGVPGNALATPGSCEAMKNLNQVNFIRISSDLLPTNVQTKNPYNFNLNIYPNPAGEYVLINFDSQISTGLEFKITDVTGKVRMTKSFIGTKAGKENIHLDISDLESGYYSLTIPGNKGVQSAKLIVIR